GDAVSDGGLFDLDAVAAVNWSTGIEEEALSPQLSVTSPFSSSFTVTSEEAGILSCYTIDGRTAGRWHISEQSTAHTLNASYLPRGVLFFVLNESSFSAVKLAN
ncbi:MAG: hypothetical protein KAH31_12715, partial [Candidatus Sabulitectum sp.]|nr:hypothetical protein [Candidatus Sabulitectum sp.]